MNIKSTLSVRMLVVIGVTALIIALPVVALMQESAVAAPPPPLRGPFKFIEVPQESISAADALAISYSPFYTETFDRAIDGKTGWRLAVNTTITNTPDQNMWEYVAQSDYPGQSFTHTLWSASLLTGRTVNYTVYTNSTYLRWMDTWAIYGPLDGQTYRQFQATFSFYLDTDPGAKFGWAASSDGTNFCGQSLSGHIGKWITATFDLPSCPGDTNRPVYLAFLLQSNGDTPNGLGAFVDNLTIGGAPWLKSYLPSIRRDPTPTAPPASPTPSYLLTKSYDFQDPNNLGWCGLDQTDFGSITFQPSGSNVYMAVKAKGSNNIVMQSPRHTTPDNYRITARFGLLRFNSGLDLSAYNNAQFGLIFGVDGNTFDPGNCDVTNYNNLDGGFYRFSLQVSGSGYQVKLEKYNYGPWSSLFWGSLPSSITINRSDWNTIQLDRNGSGIVGYINGVQVFNLTDGTWPKGRYFGVYTEALGNNSDSNNTAWESDWDNINIYNMTP